MSRELRKVWCLSWRFTLLSYDVKALRFISQVRKKCLHVVPGDQFDDQAVGIIGISEIGGSTDARGNTHGEHSDFEAVQAKVALASIAHRRIVTLSIPVFCVFVVRFHAPIAMPKTPSRGRSFPDGAPRAASVE